MACQRLTIQGLHDLIGIAPSTPGYGKLLGPQSKKRLSDLMSNKSAMALTHGDYLNAAIRLDVPIGHIKGSKKVEAPRGPYDKEGRPSCLYERHLFHRNSDPVGKFSSFYPNLSGKTGYGPGGYGSFDDQFNKFMAACALDPEAAFQACSWGAFQVLGENAVPLGYDSAYHMVKSLVTGEAAHLETYVRFIEVNGLQDELRACKPHDPESCIPFVSKYNGKGFRSFNYHVNFAEAIA
jgi:hypothetical protein